MCYEKPDYRKTDARCSTSSSMLTSTSKSLLMSASTSSFMSASSSNPALSSWVSSAPSRFPVDDRGGKGRLRKRRDRKAPKIEATAEPNSRCEDGREERGDACEEKMLLYSSC